MSKKINAYGSLGYNPYTARPNSADRAAQKPARVEQPDNTRTGGDVNEQGASASGAPAGELSAAEQRMILRAFPEDPNLSLRLYGPNRDAQTVNPSAVGNQLDVQG